MSPSCGDGQVGRAPGVHARPLDLKGQKGLDHAQTGKRHSMQKEPCDTAGYTSVRCDQGTAGRLTGRGRQKGQMPGALEARPGGSRRF